MSIFHIIFVFFLSNFLIASDNELGSVVVSPNRSVINLDKVGSSVFFIDNSNIEKSSSTTVSGLLQEFGGFTIATKGNKGSDPSYFNRGLSRKYIKILVDGMDLSDITAPQEEPTYIDNIPMNNINNIEILNGSQGTLYGKNAIGGVISINSNQPNQSGLSQSTFVEAGSYGTIKNSNSIKYLNNDLKFVLNIDGERSNGYSSFIDTGLASTEKDGYYLYGTSLLSNYKINNNLELNFNGRFYKQHNEHDNNFSYPGDSLVYYRDDKISAFLFDIIFKNAQTTHKLSYQPTYTTRINTSGAKYEYDGKKNKLEYLLSTQFFNFDSLSGIEYLEKKANMSGKTADQNTYSIFSEFRLVPFINTNIDLSARREYDSYYGSFDTGRLQVNHTLMENIILRSSIGTGYRTPTPYELYSAYGNKDLTPEKSLSYDLGGEINIDKINANIYLSMFETRVEDIITYASAKYRQTVANLKSNGFESRVKIGINDKISTSFNYSKTNAKENDGDSVKLVPKDKLVFSLNIRPTDKLNINSNYQFSNKAKDTKYNELPAYKSLNLNTTYSIKENSNAFIKIENLLNRKNIVNRGGGTSENLGYKSPDFSLFIGLKFEN